MCAFVRWASGTEENALIPWYCVLGIWHGRECGIGVMIEVKWGSMKEVWNSDVRMGEWC